MQNVISAQCLTRIALAASICLGVSLLPANATEPFTPLDRKSFNTIPPNPAPSEAQRRELERVVGLCIETAERSVPGSRFEATVDGGIVNTAGIDRGRFNFWKCMLDNGQPLAPIKK